MSFPAPCPPPCADDLQFVATVVSVEHAHYDCDVRASPSAAQNCIEVDSQPPLCSQTLRLQVSDGTQRTGTVGGGIGVSWCDLPAGLVTMKLCTAAGELDCSADLPGDGRSFAITAQGSLPHFSRYHLHADQPVARLGGRDIVVDADAMTLTVGERLHFTVAPPTSDRPPVLSDGCSIAGPSPPGITVSPPVAREHGCAGCASGDGSSSLATVLALGVFVAVPRRRRTARPTR